MTGLVTVFVLSAKTPELEVPPTVTAAGVTVTAGSELVMVAVPPLPPAAAVRVNVPLLADPPDTELAVRLTAFKVAPAEVFKLTCA